MPGRLHLQGLEPRPELLQSRRLHRRFRGAAGRSRRGPGYAEPDGDCGIEADGRSGVGETAGPAATPQTAGSSASTYRSGADGEQLTWSVAKRADYGLRTTDYTHERNLPAKEKEKTPHPRGGQRDAAFVAVDLARRHHSRQRAARSLRAPSSPAKTRGTRSSPRRGSPAVSCRVRA